MRARRSGIARIAKSLAQARRAKTECSVRKLAVQSSRLRRSDWTASTRSRAADSASPVGTLGRLVLGRLFLCSALGKLFIETDFQQPRLGHFGHTWFSKKLGYFLDAFLGPLPT